MIKIIVRPRGSVEIVEVSGTGTVIVASSLRERLAQLLESGESFFILNLTRGPVLDSALLGELVACRERARKHDGIIKLVLNPKQRDFLVSTRVDQLFEIFRDEDEALDSFDAWTTTAGIP